MANLEDWIIEQGLRGSDVGSLLAGFADRLAQEGIPLVRAYLALPTVNPTIRVYTHVWTRSAGMIVEGDELFDHTDPVVHDEDRPDELLLADRRSGGHEV